MEIIQLILKILQDVVLLDLVIYQNLPVGEIVELFK
jgi:hypothetical protein